MPAGTYQIAMGNKEKFTMAHKNYSELHTLMRLQSRVGGMSLSRGVIKKNLAHGRDTSDKCKEQLPSARFQHREFINVKFRVKSKKYRRRKNINKDGHVMPTSERRGRGQCFFKCDLAQSKLMGPAATAH